MDALYGILVLAVLIGIGYLIQKGKNAAWKAANKNILYRSEYKEGRELVSKPLILETTASVEDIMQELSAYVTVVENNSGYKAVVYQASRSDNRITYAYGNKLVPKTFEAVVMFTNNQEKTVATFKFLTWHERDGMVSSQDVMKKLSKQVKAAFKAAEGVANNIDIPAGGNAVMEQKKGQNPQNPQEPSDEMSKCPECGGFNKKSESFCTSCGKEIYKVKRCKACGSQLSVNTNYCVICGADVAEFEMREEKERCPACGREISKNNKFCTKCGIKL